MKTRQILAVIALFATIMLPASSAFAETTHPAVSTTKATTTDTPAQLKARLEKRKAELKTKPTASQQKRLQARCKNAQGKLQSVSQKALSTGQNREKVYAKLLEDTTKLEQNLKSGGVDTAKLGSSVGELKTAVDTFKVDSNLYTQAVSDAASLECQTDPVAFQASLAEARAGLQKVRTDAAAIRSIMNEKVKPALVEAKKALHTEGNS